MELNQIIRQIADDKISEIHTCLPARIDEYDPEKMRAKVILLAQQELDGTMQEVPPIVEAPVSFLKAGPFIIRPPYEEDDPCLVVFSEKAHDRLLINEESADPEHKRMHSFDDAIVIGGLQLESDDDLNPDYTEDLLIENTELDTRIVLMNKESKAFVEANEVHLGAENATYSVILGELFQQLYNVHTHPGVLGATGPPVNTMTETELSNTSYTES